ncbi:MAG: S8 family serine peptidase [Coriobacteriia bacterium]|nr:S8 family serine peptidase [Coriobacteriia bacterium]MBN2821670.1 S8 family serine peptidase [Coriobacteriia bacterium]
MTESSNTGSGWQVRKVNDPSGWQGGPYTWEDLVSYAREGRIAALDPVWHPSLDGWVPAQNIPGLFSAPVAPQPAVTAQPTPTPAPQSEPATAPQPAYAPATPTPAAAAPKRKKRGLLIAAIIAAVVVVGSGIGAWALLGNGGGALADGPEMGALESSVPSRDSLIETAEWGEVPANQICMVMVDGASRKDAEKTADALGGSVVGEVEYVNLYQVEFTGTTEDDLVAAIADAEADANVDYAYPVSQVYQDAEIWGVRQSPYDDPVYAGGAGDGYKAVGVDKAWTYIKGSGVELNKVKVGVVDDGIYMPGESAENEFEGNVNVEFPDEEAGELANAKAHKNGSTNEAGSHGTAVSTIIGGDPDNGGPSGVAGPLGEKLTISMINHFTGKYGDTTSTPDPDDPTKLVWYNGKSYSIGSLVAITKQIENGAKVINCSWGNSDADPKEVETYKRFFTKMAADHPDVLFVCSGGNGGNVMDGSKRYPSGLALDNMITVGALEKDGKTADYADKASDDYEITLGAPGSDSVVGLKGAGGAEMQDGSSFAAPHVAAAAAILKSLNPKLSAGDIKRILTETARTSVANPNDPKAPPVAIDAGMGGKILAVDQAVLKVINDLRAEKGLAAMTPEDLEKLGVVDAVAITGDLGEYQVKGIVEAVGEKGATLKIDVYGENMAIGGKTQQTLSSAGEAEWNVTLPEDKGTIVVTRLDNGAKSIITIEDIDINGHWSGTFTFTKVDVDADIAEEQGCTAEILQALVGKPAPMTLDLTVGDDGQGTGTMFVNFNAIMEEADSDPTDVTVTYSGTTLTITPADSMPPMTAQVSRSGDTLKMSGEMVMVSDGWTINAVFTLSKPVPTE